MTQTETHCYFLTGVFSNFHRCSFFDGTRMRYNCVEQYMMAMKASCFRDWNAYDRIMASTSAKEQKAIGRTVKDFNDKTWDEIKYQVVLNGNHYKFSQNSELRKKLLDTGDRFMVECNSQDKIWSCGLSIADAMLTPENKWPGENLLGKILMEVRSEI